MWDRQDGWHHYYLIVGNIRFDSPGLFLKPKIHTNRNGGPPLASTGVVFKLGVDQATFDKIKNALTSNRNLTCLHGVCQVLSAGNLGLVGPRSRISAVEVAANLMSGNVRTADGTHIPVELIASSQGHLDVFLQNARWVDFTQATAIGMYGSSLGASVFDIVWAIPALLLW